MPERIKKGDNVMVISGRDKGKNGKVLEVFPDIDKVIVEKIGTVKKHQKPTQKFPGGIIEKLTKIHVSKIKLVCPRCNEPSRIKSDKLKDGSSVRVCKKCEEIIDKV